MAIKVQDWDFRSGTIEKPEGGGKGFVSSDSVIIGATPMGVYNQASLQNAYVIGLIQDFSLDQQRIVPEIFEVGSKGKYVISTGKVNGQLSISRVIFDGPNLLYVLYGGEEGVQGATTEFDKDIAGYGQFLINLSSSFFTRPIGLVFMFRDSEGDPVGAFFFENGVIRAHNVRSGANQPLVAENVVITYENIYPLLHKDQAQAIPAISG